ncbi:ATP-dependent RNA helicase HrpA [Thiomicrorhabdus xiamenensis]|uniref:ATP-dependent RNA helicase HrpA n=1 Tax=Thiomicrorhabdus xiamenensis TaxID=2739063 RepID=A0A7D4TAV5_9GAMM|nr:ATP-dependent RNA helicase HrpA [Thiomicrorhabdus xiamenensis]QKI89366.1 ATP-dependent RNA helicase HrpA [Thiomicrorhabdus xiamenensis]
MLLNLPNKKEELIDLINHKTLLSDRHKLLRALKDQPESIDNPEKVCGSGWINRLKKSIEKVEEKLKKFPEISYPDNLPVSARKDELVDLIKNHQVVVIAGETGSGKTTQIPKICLEAGQGVFGKIGCTQPRRLAARSVAERIAEELGSHIGDLVGYQVRFLDQVKEQSLLKVMTDGILLAEVQNDPYLNRYDTIIIDEAHERSINIDFLLGILKQLIQKRKDLKVVITSATINTERFADHFTVGGKRPPIVEVSGRTYPVEVRYRPLVTYEDDAGNEIEQDMGTAIADAVEELGYEDPFGDILVFQVGERDIKETAEILRKRSLKNTEIVPLYARLSMAEQNKVFQTSQKRRIILSTNVAETSLTVPGIKYVIDPGQVRISRYSVRSKVQRLPVEKISQASANQRKGRCGRVSEGICIRLYDEEDFRSRPEFTDPEIHRTSLASIILTMAQLRLGSVKNFPFIEPPNDKAVNDGYRQLFELGALDEKRRLTDEGRKIAKLPIDPSVAKMVMEAEKNGVLAEVIIIASALSIQDPRDINEANMQAARQAHKRWEDERSDFLFFLNLWRFYEHQRRHLSQSKLRKLCKTNFLSYLRMKEWHELGMQLEQSLKRIGLKIGELHLYEEVKKGNEVIERLSDLHSIAIHRSLMAGLLGNISTRDEDKSYLGARNTKLFIHPSSVLFKRRPKWMLSAELVETSKLFARTNAEIDVHWVENLARHLIKHSYADPHWQKKAGQVGAYESITLFGLPIINRRHCNYGPINPKEAHKIFLRHGLVEGELFSKVEFFVHNQNLVAEIEKMESKLRRPELLVDDEQIYQFYAERIPGHIYSKPAFEKWVRKVEKSEPQRLQDLFLDKDQLMKQQADERLQLEFPDQMALPNNIRIDVDYHFEPGKKQDGVVFKLPLGKLNLFQAEEFEWLTPGLLKEKVAFYIKALPKNLRKQFIPAPQYADLVLQEMSPQRIEQGRPVTFLAQLVWALNRRGTQKVKSEDFGALELPDHLKPYFILQDRKGKKLAEGEDLQQLKEGYQHLVEAQIERHQAKQDAQVRIIEHWDFGDLQPSQTIKEGGVQMTAYPALQSVDGEITLKLFGEQAQALKEHRLAVLALLRRELNDKDKYLQKKLPLQKACLCYAPYGTCVDLTEEIIHRALLDLVPSAEEIRTQALYEETLERVRTHWIEQAQGLAKLVTQILTEHQKIAKQVKGTINPRWLASLADIRTQLDTLISSGFVLKTPPKWFQQLPRYLQALQKRLEKIDQDPNKDQQAIRKIAPLLETYRTLAEDPVYAEHAELIEIRWLLEELRVSLFSQPLKTIEPVSIQRLEKRLKAL